MYLFPFNVYELNSIAPQRSLFRLDDVDQVLGELDDTQVLQIALLDDEVFLRGKHCLYEVPPIREDDPPTIAGGVVGANPSQFQYLSNNRE